MKPRTYVIFTALSLALLTVGVSVTPSVTAQADERYSPVRDAETLKECGDCHMAFQPQMLPARSWEKLMDDLPNHFGEDASLAEDQVARIRNYLTDNAADSSWLGGKFMRGLSKNDTPLRISKTPYWVREHNEEVSNQAWGDPRVKTKANCIACHRAAESGNYDDDDWGGRKRHKDDDDD